MGRRNPIHVIGEPIRNGVTWLSDELIRSGAHDGALGSDGFVVMAYLLSRASTPTSSKRSWETSAAQISEQFGWGRNRERAKRALERAVKDNRLLIRGYLRGGQPVGYVRDDGQMVQTRLAYVVCAGGRRFTEEELFRYSPPIELESKFGSPQ